MANEGAWMCTLSTKEGRGGLQGVDVHTLNQGRAGWVTRCGCTHSQPRKGGVGYKVWMYALSSDKG
eukprot:353209-Chlamydomonas_euryale.AAC.3